MGTDLCAASARAQGLFALADDVTGLPVTRLCAEGPLERLTDTDVAQPAVVTTSLAALAVLEDELGLRPAAVAGHSVGELAAYAASGALDARATLELVHARAQAMSGACTSVDGGMSAVLGLDEPTLRAACEAACQEGSSVEIANMNAPGQLIVSGARDALERAGERARAAGARRVLPLNVAGPFHSAYMRSAAETFAEALAGVQLREPEVPVVLNASARATRSPDELRHELGVQIYSPVRWIETLQRLAALGCDTFLEVGPGQVLAGMVRRTLPRATAASFGGLADLPAIRALLSSVAAR